MNKQETLVVVALFLGLMGWLFYQSKHQPPKPKAATMVEQAASAATEAATNVPPVVAPAAPVLAAPEAVAPAAVAVAVTPAPAEAESGPETTVALSNALATVTVSSRGGAIVAVELRNYRATLDKDSPPLVLDLHAAPALAVSGIAGLETSRNIELTPDSTGAALQMSRDLGDGLRFERRIEMVEHYRLRIVDRYLNGGTAAVKLPECRVTAGRMETVKSQASAQGVSYLGIDTLADVGGAKVKDWGKKDIPRMFGAQGGGCMRQGADLSRTPVQVSEIVAQPQTWLAARNKFFVLILKPDDPADNCVLHAERDPDGKALHVQAVSGELGFSAKTIEPGGSFERSFHYYVGPKDYALLKTLGARQHEIMLHAWWEWFRWICGAMLWTLNALYKVIPNYGVAIILLTAIVRILFWPITHKSTESMKRMQQVQPLVTELRAKFKDKPQKLNQEIMALYKEHKVNPMAGCLPMLVQMPVFIALYNVLRAAVELRYAGFLWIRDLSEPEGLLQGVIPVVGCLNIWPLLMTATMVWQQKLTPAAGDPAQQKMMLWFMPIFMLFILYSMPSGLIVYWTVSQVLSIVQMLHQRRMWAAKSALAKA